MTNESEWRRISELLDLVTDGDDVDWRSARRTAESEEQGKFIDSLEIVAKLAASHQPEFWGDFEILEHVGSGSFADVFRAWDSRLAREVALKVFRERPGTATTTSTSTSTAISTAAIEEALREARLLAQVKHRNVVEVYGAEERDSRVGIWMEFVVGRTLSEILQQLGPLDWKAATLCGLDLCCGLAAVHAKNLAHADIKAQNVMREEGGRILLVDFGIGQLLGELSLEENVGTPFYAAPELFDGARVSVASDIYSLGVLLYHVVTGNFPVRGANVDALRESHRRGERTRLRDARPDLPAGFASVVERALSSEPPERYDTVGEMEVALNNLLHPDKRLVEAVVAGAGPGLDSIAVLPFVDMSRDTSHEYFCDGIAEEILNKLSQHSDLRVVARTSAFRFKNHQDDIRRIGRELRVRYVLEGSVRAAGKRLRITVKLANVADGYQLWSESYDRELGDVFAVQDDIAVNVVASLKARLQPTRVDHLHVARDGSGSAEAYHCYLKARFHMNKRTSAGLRKAIEYCEQALELDGRYASAYACLADCYFLLAFQNVVPYVEAMPKAKAAAESALGLDESHSEAHASLGCALATFEWKWLESDRAFQRSLELNPGYAAAHYWRAMWNLVPTGHFAEARSEIEIARGLDPLSPVLSAGMGWQFYFARDYEGALREVERALELDEGFVMAYDVAALASAQLGRHQKARSASAEAVARSGERSLSIAVSGQIAAFAGELDAARDTVTRLRAMRAQSYVSSYAIALVLAASGDRDACLDSLESALEERSGWLVFANVEPAFDALRSTPRFDELLARIGMERSDS